MGRPSCGIRAIAVHSPFAPGMAGRPAVPLAAPPAASPAAPRPRATAQPRRPMYAVIETGGKQYRVEVGTELAVELLEVEPGQEITLERVLLVADGDEAAIGRPVVDGAAVSADGRCATTAPTRSSRSSTSPRPAAGSRRATARSRRSCGSPTSRLNGKSAAAEAAAGRRGEEDRAPAPRGGRRRRRPPPTPRSPPRSPTKAAEAAAEAEAPKKAARAQPRRRPRGADAEDRRAGELRPRPPPRPSHARLRPRRGHRGRRRPEAADAEAPAKPKRSRAAKKED